MAFILAGTILVSGDQSADAPNNLTIAPISISLYEFEKQ